MSRESIGIGVIGMGWMGVAHSRSYRNVLERFPDLQLQPGLIACVDEVESRAEATRERFGFSYSTQNWQQVIDDPKIGLVTVATPNNSALKLSMPQSKPGNTFFARSR